MDCSTRIRRIGRALAAVEVGVLALVLLSCGGGDPAAPRVSEPDAGDEQPIRVEVRILVTDDQLTLRPRTVAAFLPVAFKVVDRSSGRAHVTVEGEAGVIQPAGFTSTVRSNGLRPGRYAIRAGRGRRAHLRVVAGG